MMGYTVAHRNYDMTAGEMVDNINAQLEKLHNADEGYTDQIRQKIEKLDSIRLAIFELITEQPEDDVQNP